jgi:hypothetical protein
MADQNPYAQFVQPDTSSEADSGPNPYSQFVPGEDTQSPSLMEKLGQTWPAQAVKSLYSAATLPGDVAAGKGTVTPAVPGMWSDVDEAKQQATEGNIGKRTLNLATVASPVPAPMRAGEGVAGAAVTPKLAERTTAPTAQQLHDAADGDYAVARSMDVKVNPTAVKTFANGLQLQMERDGLRDYLAPKTFNALKEMQNPPEGAAANIADIDGMRKVFGAAARDFTNPTEQAAASRAIGELDNYVRNIHPDDVISGDAKAAQKVLDSARGNYSAAKRADLIEGKEQKAEYQAGASGSGANINNALRQQFKTILNNPKIQKGFNDDELDQMRQVVMGTKTGNAARAIGKLAPTGVVSGALGLEIGSHLMGGPTGVAALPIAGAVAKRIGEASTQRQIDALSQMTRGRSPLAQVLSSIPERVPPRAPLPAGPLAPVLAAAAQSAINRPTITVPRRATTN